jgi:hypothetical protein
MREDIQLYNLALDFAKVGAWQSAIVKLHLAIARRPQEAEYHSLLAVAYLGCSDRTSPIAPDSTLNQSQQMYHHLAKLAFHRALALNLNDPILSKYLDWVLGSSDDDHPPHPDRSPRSPQPNFPNSSTTANLIDAAPIAQIP